MRLLHTADWHLGRIFHGVHLTRDQEFLLDQVVGLAREARVDAVLVAGDVFDRAQPPVEAVNLLNDVLERLVLDLKVPVAIVAGNHDSADRLDFLSRLARRSGLHLIGGFDSGGPRKIVLEDRHGPVEIFAAPYCEPALARERLGEESARDHDSAARAMTARARAAATHGVRTIYMGHVFVSGGAESESERPLFVGGTGSVGASAFDGFHYVALGHLHKPQTVGGEGRIAYSGSLMKYSFAEADHHKSVSLVEMDERGGISVERAPLQPRRDARRLEGTLAALLADPPTGAARDDYYSVVLTDRVPLLDPLEKLRAVYPNVLHLERADLNPAGGATGSGSDRRKMGDMELFREFFRETTGEAPDEEETALFQCVATSAQAKEGGEAE